MANIGYRTVNAVGGNVLTVNLGNIASAASVPETWIFAGRLLAIGSDAEIASAPGFDPLDWYISGAGIKYQFYDGSAPDATDGPTTQSTQDVIHSIRRLTGAAAKWSIATHNGTVWSATTHTTSAKTFASRTYPSTGVIEIGGSVSPAGPGNTRFALIARCNVALTDAQINTLTTDLPAWLALPGLTNLWRFDGATVVDLVGTATQNTLTGTTVTANGFPLDAGSTGVTGTSARTLGSFVSAGAGAHGVTGTSARTLGSFVSAGTGNVGSGVSGSSARTLGSFVSAGAGTVSPAGTSARTLAPFVSAGSGTVAAPFYTLNDDFPGTSIDTSQWTVYDRLGDQVNNEVNAVIPANVRVGSGTLKIDSKFEDVVSGDTTTGAPNPRTVHYTSGQIAQKAASFLYGDVQVRAKLPGGTGLWPCIWMLGYQWQASQPATANVAGADWPNGGWWEIDIAEFMQDHRTVVNNALHFISANRTGSGEKSLPFDATSRFMVYRLVWTATSLTWMVDAEDGVGWRTLTTITGVAGTDVPNTPGYLIIHTAIGGNAATTPNPATFPQTFEVDWAQVTPQGSAVGTSARTLAPFVSAGTGTVSPPTVTGTSARTLGSFVSAGVGTHGVSGASARTLGSFVSAGVGAVNGAVQATLAGAYTFAGGVAATVEHSTSMAFAGSFAGTAAATPVHAVALAGSYILAASATATPEHPATLSGAYAWVGSVAATRELPATLSATFGFTGAAAAQTDGTVTLLGAFAFAGTAAASVQHAVTMAADFAFAGQAAVGVAHDVTGAGSYAFAGSMVATPASNATATMAGAYAYTGSAAASVAHPATFTTALGFVGGMLADVSHDVVMAAQLGFVGSMIATKAGEALFLGRYAFAADIAATPAHPAALLGAYAFVGVSQAQVEVNASGAASLGSFVGTIVAATTSPAQLTAGFAFTGSVAANVEVTATLVCVLVFHGAIAVNLAHDRLSVRYRENYTALPNRRRQR